VTELEELQGRAQRNLIAFLRTEVDLGFTFVSTAKSHRNLGNREASDQACKFTQDAVRTVRQFQDRIDDSAVRRELQDQANELAKAISSR
jgi:hypothetical protein